MEASLRSLKWAACLAFLSSTAFGQSYPSPRFHTEILDANPIWKSCPLAYIPIGAGSSAMACSTTLPSGLTIPGADLGTPLAINLANATGLVVGNGGTGAFSFTSNLPLIG